jgi:hypothetical protein
VPISDVAEPSGRLIEGVTSRLATASNQGVPVDLYSLYLSKSQLGAILDISEHSIDRLRKKRAIPSFRIGGLIRFRLADVERSLERYKTKEVAL